MNTWEKKLGLIVPSWNTVNEYEFQRVLIPAMSVHSMRIKITADDEANFTWMATQVPAASKLLAQAKVSVSPGIGFGEFGDEHVRFALIENESRIRQAIRGIKQMFRDDGLL